MRSFIVRAASAMAGLAGMVCLAIFPLFSPALHAATIGASSDTGKPSASTSYNSGMFFNINENVAVDANAGPWHKDLVANNGSASGQNRTIMEVLTNLGGVAWSDWHEQVLSRTTINQPNDAPGFLFQNGSLSVSANYGSGPVTLTQGTDYTVVAPPYAGPAAGVNGPNWETIDIFLAPARYIGVGNSLIIQKDIFEVFGDANTWMTGEAAQIGEYPTITGVPEPAAGLSFATLTLLLTSRLRRR